MLRSMSRPAEVVAISDVLAASGIAYPLPGGELTSIEALAFELVTAAGGGARQVVAGLTDSTGASVYAIGAPGTQAGGLTVVYSFAPLVPSFGSSALGTMGGPFPAVAYSDNLTVVVAVAGTSPADKIESVRLLVCQDHRQRGYQG